MSTLWLLAVAIPASIVAAETSSFITGIATSNELPQVSNGNCNFMSNGSIGQHYTAVSDDHWDATRNCGRCVRVTCVDARCADKTKSVTVHIVDRCPSCGPGGLDLSPTVFKQLTGSSPSEYKIQWQYVDCPVTGNIKYCTKGGSSNSWLAVQPTNFATGIASVQIAHQDVTMVDSCYYFLLNGGANVDISAVDIQLTSLAGETITEKLNLTADTCTDGTANFQTSTTQHTAEQATPVSPPAVAYPVSTPSSKKSAPNRDATVGTVTAPSALSVAPQSSTPLTPNAPASPSSYTFQGEQASQGTAQTAVSNSFTPLASQQNPGQGDSKYEAGTVLAPTELNTPVSILQSDATRVENEDPKQTGGTDTEQIATKSQAASSGSSPVLVALVVLAIVGVIALAAVAYFAKKKKLENKRIDRDDAMMRSFDTFSSPVQFEQTIAKI
ncbi:hypothetical protein PsorP6_017742 [Peronosclerospora sorghi]|uniref:Uncharacterized protein n=1 Tax=Peronosclerospora sorghi TaxID=230839 RepID=A0ACC0WNP3_9STRA|nr:hypothetical protein PsorP6_017742 [Peronosclerospora sorghi]